MKTTAVAALALSMLAVPAFAQSPNSSPTNPSSAATQTNGAATNPSSATSGPEFKAMTQTKLKQQLSKAGFSSIDVLDASYLVQAKTPDGNTVIMVINPPSMNTASNGALNSNVTTGSVGSNSNPNSASGNANSLSSGSGSMNNPASGMNNPSNATGATVPHPGASK